MSRDFYFYKVSKIDHEVPAVIHPASNYIEENSFHEVRIDRADQWMLDIGRKTTIEYISSNLMKISRDKFGRDYNCCSSRSYNGDFEFYYNNEFLGRVTREERKKYETVESYEAILFKKELIMRPCEGTYILYDMEEKLYTEKELLEIEAEAEKEYGTESGYEVLYTLFKCAQLAREGNLIWCEIC